VESSNHAAQPRGDFYVLQGSTMEKYTCKCCGLDYPAGSFRQCALDDYKLPTVCKDCGRHQSFTVPVLLARDQSHLKIWHERVELALGLARQWHGKMKTAYASRDRLLGMLNDKADFHYPNGKGGCACGAKECDLMRILENSWVRERLNDYRDRQAA
jgi:hypothetical protein